jgi:hypothetical protein
MPGIPDIVYDAGKGLLKWWLDREHQLVKVYRIKEPDDTRLESALKLCERMLPANEVDSPANVARWLAEVKQETAEGRCRLIDYLLVSVLDGKVCGVLYGQYYPLYKLMFISYVVADAEDAAARDGRATQSLFKYLRAARDDELAEMEGIVFEMEYPNPHTTEQNRRSRSRSRLFEFYAQQLGITVRILDIPYRQPRLDLDDPSCKEEPQLLAYGRTALPAISRSVPREEVQNVISFVYKAIYGDQFEGDPNQDLEYRRYLDTLCQDLSDKLPAEVPVVSFARGGA